MNNILEAIQNFSPFENDIFSSNESCLEFLKKCGVISQTNICPTCFNRLNIGKYQKSKDGYVYKCDNRHCQRRYSLKFNTSLNCFSIDIKKNIKGCILLCF
ncbi:hypothetical protein DMUE_4821 [Dictyocoela muelleri]|nr:hypothetical protein DMUE_4821 [Dictyocoela muelleri]